MASPIDVARALNAAVLAGDVDRALSLYREDAVVWRNVDDRELVKKQVRTVIAFLATKVADLRYEDVRLLETPEGYVQRHRMRGIAETGEKVTVDACLVVRVVDGKIARLEEYFDSAAMAPFFQ